MFNGTYNPETGRPVNLVKDIGEKMLGDKNAYMNPAREVPTTLGVDRGIQLAAEPDYPNVWSRLDDLDVCLQQLREQVDNLEARLNGVMSDHQEHPCPGPRAYNSALTGRVCQQADFVDEMTRKLNDIRDRLTV